MMYKNMVNLLCSVPQLLVTLALSAVPQVYEGSSTEVLRENINSITQVVVSIRSTVAVFLGDECAENPQRSRF
jgi:hypothetical protein